MQVKTFYFVAHKNIYLQKKTNRIFHRRTLQTILVQTDKIIDNTMFLAFFVCGNKRNHYKNRKRYFLFLLQLVVFVLWVHTHLSLHTYISVNAGYYIQYMRWLFLLCPKVTCRDVFFSFLGETQHSNEVSLMYVIQYIFNNQNNKKQVKVYFYTVM